MSVATALRLSLYLCAFFCLSWIIFAFTLHHDEHDNQIKLSPSVVDVSAVHRFRRPLTTPAPDTKPKKAPSMFEYIGDQYNLRACACLRDWKEREGESVCRCENVYCHHSVTPIVLTEAKNQGLCQLDRETGYNCVAYCSADSPDMKWSALPCSAQGNECDARITRDSGKDVEKNEATGKIDGLAKAASKDATVQEGRSVKVARAENQKAADKLGFDPDDYYDLRGLSCEMREGKEQCFVEDEQGRELCPSFVNAEYLTFHHKQNLCSQSMSHEYFCRAACQEGSEEVKWTANEIVWCDKNPGSCGTKPPLIKKSEYSPKQWSAEPDPKTPCEIAWEKGEKPSKIHDVTWGLLTHEPVSFRSSMLTYEKYDLFSVVDEFLIFINSRTPEVDAVALEFQKKYPVIRILGSETNLGILKAMNRLIEEASNPYFIFLERDFQLIEPATCVKEQLEAGKELIQTNVAQVVRYRHKRHPGRPNWAAKMYIGREDDVFKSGQPNLFCNHFYWYKEPEKRWPDKMYVCHKDSEGNGSFWCSDSFYCNWTNNPQLWSVKWWNTEYVDNFSKFKNVDPYKDLEAYMNWEPNSWNTRKFIVAQGDGLFKHVDRNNFGPAT